MPLTEGSLRERLAEAETRFNAAKVKKDQAEASVQEADNECLRVQGEYRAIQALLDYEVNSQVQNATSETPEPSVAVVGEGKHGRS